MFAYLKGLILKKHENSLILDVNQVGYLVRATQTLLKEIKEKEELSLYIHTQVSENDIALFGVATEEELNFLKLLISVSGIGPKSALGILDGNIDKVKQALVTENILALTELPGIGRKTAERMIVELKDKIKLDTLPEVQLATRKIEMNEDALAALLSLGYSRYEASKLLAQVPEDVTEIEDIVKMALQKG